MTKGTFVKKTMYKFKIQHFVLEPYDSYYDRQSKFLANSTVFAETYEEAISKIIEFYKPNTIAKIADFEMEEVKEEHPYIVKMPSVVDLSNGAI